MKRRRRLKKPVKYFLIFLIFVFFFAGLKNLTDYDDGKDAITSVKTDIQNSKPHYENITIADNLPLKKKLKLLKKYDDRIGNILQNYNRYPKLLLQMLTRNLNMLDFVLEYPQNKGKVFAHNVGNIKKGKIPLLLQWDHRWGYAEYGDCCIGTDGCGPTALSMVIVGLTGDTSITPYVVARFAQKNGYCPKSTGTSWSLMTEGAQSFGIQSREIALSESTIFQALKSHHPIICSMRKGDFTTSGHFIVLTGIENGKIRVNDSNSTEKSNQLWEYERLEYQIKNLWEYSI